MIINLAPQRSDDALSVSVAEDIITINGDAFDFSSLAEGDMVSSVPCEWIVGPVSRVNGEISLTLILPHGANPSQAVAYPQPITVTSDGPFNIPKDAANVEA